MWDISTTIIKKLSKLQLIEFWAIIFNPIKLLQCALLHTLVMVVGPGGEGEIMKEGKTENSEWKKNKEGTGDTERKGKREEVKGLKGPVMTEPTVSGKGKSVRFGLKPKATLAKKGGTNLEGPPMTLAQHSANHDRSVANAMKYKEDTATLKEAEKITERACAAVAESAEIPYHLWRNHIEHVIPRIRLPEDWELRVIEKLFAEVVEKTGDSKPGNIFKKAEG